ncbi:MAG: peptidylprolyl isomerase [Ferruginibacter sp.]
MQIIQTIRDKGAAIVIVVIALSLIGFILMDANSGSNTGGMFSSNTTSVGKVNGKSVEINEFNSRVSREENNEARKNGVQPSGADVLRIREQVWNQVVAENVFYREADKLGITLTAKEFSALLMSNEPSNPFMQERGLLDATGKLDIAKATEALTNIKKLKGEQRADVDAQILEPLKLSTAASKYGGLIGASAYYPTWMMEKDAADAKMFSTISYVGVAYNEISDSTVKVTDEDIMKYVEKRKPLFKQEAGRTISYMTFSQLPSAADSAKTRQMTEELKASFAADTNSNMFVARNASAIDFKDEFLPVSKITSSVKDTIIKQGTGVVYGPYIEGNNYALAKIIGTKMLPDSVKARHILLGVNDPQTGQPIRSDSAAKKLADSLLAAIKSGADFAAMAAKYSSDGSSQKGGDLGTFGYGTMVPEFNAFTFSKTVGDKDVVRTQFGYHVIEIMSQTNFKPAYKIAYVAKQIVPSDETINAASLAATKASANKNAKEMAAYAEKNGIPVIALPTVIKENDYSIGNMQDARSLVRWAFEAKKGAVSEPIAIGDDFIVATVNTIYKEGTQDAATARAGAEAAVRNLKKADMIMAKMGANPTLETAAAAYNKQVLMAGADSTITMSARIINGIGGEPKVIGASFSKEFQTKVSPPIPGANGVYVIKINSISPKADTAPDQQAAQTTARFASIRQQTNNWFEALKKQAEIKDTRAKFF